jgi:uncharacterized protein (DUF2384 family)
MTARKAAARKAIQPALRAPPAGGGKRVAAPAPASRRTRVPTLAALTVDGPVGQALAIPDNDVLGFARTLVRATPMQLVETERRGVPARFVKQLALRLGMPASRVFVMLALPRATAEKKAAAGDSLTGHSAHAALAVTRLLGVVEGMVERSTAPEAAHLDVGRWLGQWLERPQPALGGRKAADLLDTPTGYTIVGRVLGALESGTYQ